MQNSQKERHTKLVRQASFASKMPCHKHRSCCIFVLMMLNGHCSYLENGDNWNFKIEGLPSLKLTANPAPCKSMGLVRFRWFTSCLGQTASVQTGKTPVFSQKKIGRSKLSSFDSNFSHWGYLRSRNEASQNRKNGRVEKGDPFRGVYLWWSFKHPGFFKKSWGKCDLKTWFFCFFVHWILGFHGWGWKDSPNLETQNITFF